MVLPLVGYGGSSLMACMGVVGLLLGIKREADTSVTHSSWS
jgi:cell division protein FtsW (lipid II flippase)